MVGSPYTIVDVINMAIFAGGRPVFADGDLDTRNISVAEVVRLITPKYGTGLTYSFTWTCCRSAPN